MSLSSLILCSLSPSANGKSRWSPFLHLFAAITSREGSSPFERSSDLAQSAQEQIAAFEGFFRQLEPRISRYLWQMTGDEQVAHDLSQETFLRAWEHYAEICTYVAPTAWLFRVATNLALGHLRRNLSPVAAAAPLLDDFMAGSDLFEQVVERDLILQTLLCLRPKPRALLVMREIYGLSTEEAGQALGMSLAAARKMLNRAHQQFRQSYLRKEGRA